MPPDRDPDTNAINAATILMEAEEIRQFRERLDSRTPPTQDEINRFLLRRAERDSRLNTALHDLMHQAVKGISELRDDVKTIRRMAYAFGAGAVAIWFLWTMTNIRPATVDTVNINAPSTNVPHKP